MPIKKTNSLVKILVLLFSSGILLCLIFFPLNSHAAFTKQINYQGKLTDASGVAVSDATRSIVFSLYTAASGGSAIWTETDSVTTTGGLFSVMLGAVSSLDNINFNQTLYLGINVAGDGEMTPRKILGSVPSAFDSLRLDGNASSTNIDISNYLVVSGTSTLATTTLAYTSKIGTVSSYLTVEPFDIYGLTPSTPVPLIRFHAGNFPFGEQYGAIADALIIAQKTPYSQNYMGPALLFMPDTFAGGETPSISYGTTSDPYLSGILRVRGVSTFKIDNALLSVSSSTATSTFEGNLKVRGLSNLATTTMAFGSWVGDGATKINFSNLSFGAAGSVPMISFSSPTFNPGSPALTYGAMGDGLVIYENSGSMNPEFRLLDKNFHSAAIQFSTSTNTMHFTDASNYYIDFRSNNDAGLKIGNDTNYLTLSNRLVSVTGPGGSLVGLPSIRPNSLGANANYWETQGGFIISEGSSTPSLSYNGDPILQFGPYDLSSGVQILYATTTKQLQIGGYGGFATTSFTSDLIVRTNGGSNSLTVSNKSFGPFQFETMKFYSSDVGSMGAIEGRLIMFDSLDGGGYSNDNPGIMFASRGFTTEANITFATTSNQLEFRDATHYYFRDGSVGINTETPDGVSKFLVTGGTKLAGNATTTGYLTIGTAPTGAGFTAGDLNVQNSLVVGNGITLGGVFRSTWPTGSGSANIGFWATSSTNALIGYPDLDGEYAIVVGAEATTSPNTKFEVNGNSKLGGTLTVTGLSTLANASATVFSVSGNSYLSTTQVDGNLNVTAGNYYKYNGVNLASASTTLNNYFFGGAGNLTMTGEDNNAVGVQAFARNTTGQENNGFGSFALFENTTGSNNNAFGSNALSSNRGGNNNNAFGGGSLLSNTSGNSNTAIGQASLSSNTTGSQNNAIGLWSLESNTTGQDNIAIGAYSGRGYPSPGTEDYGSVIDNNSIFIGRHASRDGSRVASTTSLTNATAIGYNARVGASDSFVLGGMGTDAVKVGIGTSTPNSYLTINGSSATVDLFRIATSTNQNILLVDKSGRVGIGTSTLNASFSVNSNYSDLSATRYGQKYDNYFSTAVSTSKDQYGAYFSANNTIGAGANSTGKLIGLASYANARGSTGSSVSSLYGIITGGGSVGGGGTISAIYGLYLEPFSGSTAASNNYGIYQADPDALNYFAGSIYMGGTSDGTYPNAIYYGGSKLAWASSTTRSFYFGDAGNFDSQDSWTIGIGYKALETQSTGGLNTVIGSYAMRFNTTGDNNVAVGFGALGNNTEGDMNAASGLSSLGDNTTGFENAAFGYQSMLYNTTGYRNSGFGASALGGLSGGSQGSYNSAMGFRSLVYNSTGSFNAAFGVGTLEYSSTSAGMVAIGYLAGTDDDAFFIYPAGQNNASIIDASSTFIGAHASRDGAIIATTTALTKAVAIGYNAKIGTSSAMALGGLDSDAVRVGIATSTPDFALVIGSGHTVEGLKSIQVPYGSLCVDNDGYCTPSGTAGNITARSYTTGGADLAENYTSSLPLETGDIVSPLGGDQITKATTDQLPLGIVSTQPGITMGNPNDDILTHQYPIALSGRVPVKVNLEGGPIKVGDPIKLSSLPGIGTKATSSTETIGIALESFNSSTQGQILVFVKLGYAHLDSQISNGQITAGNLWTQDETTGRIKALASLDLNNLDLLNVRAIVSASGNWSVDDNGLMKVKKLQTDELIVEKGVTIKDKITGAYTCITVENGAIKTTLGICSDETTIYSPPVPPSPEPPASSTESTTTPAEETTPPAETPPLIPEPTPEPISSPPVDSTIPL